jgi:hypothetical protein
MGSKNEFRVQMAIMRDSHAFLESGFRCLHKEPESIGLRIEAWLKPETEAPAWDSYRHGIKWLDLVGLNKDNKLVLCEFKWSGGEGDSAAYQLRDYYLMLKTDVRAQEDIRNRAAAQWGITAIDFEDGVLLYVVVAGHVSQLLLQRTRMLPEANRFKVFQARPESGDPASTNWKCIEINFK